MCTFHSNIHPRNIQCLIRTFKILSLLFIYFNLPLFHNLEYQKFPIYTFPIFFFFFWFVVAVFVNDNDVAEPPRFLYVLLDHLTMPKIGNNYEPSCCQKIGKIQGMDSVTIKFVSVW